MSVMLQPSTAVRPPTARPSAARPVTATSSRNEGSHVIAVIEGRGVSREVGVAALDKDTGNITIVQVMYALFVVWLSF
jgi:DNA mismatch repair protein MSH4